MNHQQTNDRGERTITRRVAIGTGTAVIAGVVAAAAAPVVRALGPDGVERGARATRRAVRIAPPEPRGGYEPDVRYVGIYGFPGTSTLGILGQLSLDQAVERARSLAEQYAQFDRPVVPIFEILASVAAADAGGDGDYSNEFDPSMFDPYLVAARDNSMQVVFDLQTGRSTFPDQAREYEPLWRYPNAHIALDPEWRFDPPGIPGGGRIGTVSAAEVNATVDYIDSVVQANGLPPKMLVVHQFTSSMITDKPDIRGTDNVHVILHMDGFGSLTRKRGSYERMISDLPAGATTGWKNFFEVDSPTPTPTQTLGVSPAPILVTYQ